MIVLDGTRLTPADVVAVARGGVEVELSAAAVARNDQARASIAALLARGEPLYGATTGVGALRDHAITDSEREQFQWNLLRSHAVSAGRPLAREVVRAGMVVRLNQLGAGGAGVAPRLLSLLAAALNDDSVPLARELGSLGTGDLAVLCEIALALLGEGKFVLADGTVRDAPPPAVPVRLGLRDGLGFISSNAVTVGQSALLLVDGRRLHDAWLTVAALSFEAIGADQAVLSERVQAARGSADQSAVAARLRQLLAGPSEVHTGRDRPVQEPYPFRVVSQVDGVSQGALDQLEAVLGRELNARGENALIDDGHAWTTGNFHAAELTAALDALRAAFAQSASLIAARVSALLDPRMSGMPAFLASPAGPNSGMMMLEYTAHSAAAEVRSFAAPMATQSSWASFGVESHASLAATAARRTADMLGAMRVLIATELVVAMRALHIGQRVPCAPVTLELFELANHTLTADLGDRPFGRDVEAARELLDRWTDRDHARDLGLAVAR